MNVENTASHVGQNQIEAQKQEGNVLEDRQVRGIHHHVAFATSEIVDLSGLNALKVRRQSHQLPSRGQANTVQTLDAGVSREGPRVYNACLLYTSPSPRDDNRSRMPSSA